MKGMADPFTDYASNLLVNLLLQSPFVDFSLIIGISIFFLYFHKTKYWSTYDWTKKIIFGLFIGFFTVGILYVAILPLETMLEAVHAQFLDSIVFYPLPLILLFYLFKLRFQTIKAPLCSNEAKKHFRNFFSLHRTYWSLLMIAFSLALFSLFLVSALFTPFLNKDALFAFGGFLLFINYLAILGYILILTFVAQLSFFSLDTEALLLAISSCFGSFNKQKIDALKIIDEEKKYVGSSKKRRQPRLNKDFFHKLLLLIMLVMVLVAFDRGFQLVTPSVSNIETPLNANQIVVYRFENGSLLYTIQVEKTYWINLPMIPIQALNLTIPNPSNFSLSQSDAVFGTNSGFGQLKTIFDNTVSVDSITNYEGKIESLNVMPLSSSIISEYQAPIRLSYSNVLDIQPIKISDPVETSLDNGSIEVTESLFINNTENIPITSQSFPLFQTWSYGNLTSYLCVINGVNQPLPPSNDFMSFNQWLLLEWGLTAPSNRTTIITVYATFDGKSQP